MNHPLFAAVVACIAAAVPAQVDESQQPSPTAAWEQFVRANPSDTEWHVAWNKATETPSAIWGPGLRVAAGPAESLADARRRADLVLTEYADLLGVGASTTIESIGEKVGRVYVFVLDQQFAGLEVVGGRADVRVHETGGISMFGSQLVPIPKDFAITPAIPAGRAEAVAFDHLQVEPGAARPKPRLVIWADVDADTPTAVRLAWQVQVDARPAELVIAKVYVDARNGTVLESVDEVYYCGLGHAHVTGESVDVAAHREELAAALRSKIKLASPFMAVTGSVQGFVRTGDSATSAGVLTPLANLLVSIDGGGSTFTDASGNFSIPASGTTPVTVRVSFGAGRSRHANGGIRAVQGTAVSATASATPGGAPVTLQLATSRSEFDLSQTTAYYFVNDVNEWARGLLGNTSQLATASNIQTDVNIAQTCNASYTGNTINFYAAGSNCRNTAFKTVIYHEWGHGLDDRYGGISQTEGLSEGWGDILAMYRSGSPVVGLGFSTTGNIRDGRNTRTYPVSSSSVHTQGQTWMGFAWDLRENLRASLGATAGAAIAEQIVVGSIVADATNQPAAVREVFVLDDDDANLNNGVPHYAELSAAALGRTLPFPELQVGTVTHTPLASTTEQLKSRLVRVRAVPSFGAYSGANLVFNTGSGTQTQPMIKQGNDFLALLPGVLSPQSVSYHVDVRHTTGFSSRLPETGDFKYSIGQETVLFFDDMESGPGSWTHAQVARQDDWQWGSPQGKGGDPNAAFSASNAWGNDLGPTGFNGEYQNNVHNFLRSPSINCVGQTGVTLSLRRYLRVESSQYDQAEILVNGTSVWINPFSTDLLDTAWTEMTVPIPQADNRLVNIDWRLISDGGLVFGGWTIDDVKVFSFQALPPPAVQFRATPPQVPATGTSQLAITGTPGAPAAILLSTQPGPTPALPGLTLEVGATFVSVPVSLDANGDFRIDVPGAASMAGTILYGQALEIVGGSIQSSNGMLLMFGD